MNIKKIEGSEYIKKLTHVIRLTGCSKTIYAINPYPANVENMVSS